MTPTTWTSASRTVTGQIRDHNEDAVCELPEAGAFAVADGMGGHAAGEVASRIAVETVEERLGGRSPRSREDASGPADADLDALVREANRRILSDAREHPGRSGMGTTLTLLLLEPAGRWRVAHVGDSRAYRLRDGTLDLLTRDHTWVGEQVARGKLSREEARTHPMSSMLNRALGTGSDVAPDLDDGDARPGDRFLLTSDGLTDMVPEPRLAELLAAGDGPAEAVDALVEAANEAGGRDNISALAVQVSGG